MVAIASLPACDPPEEELPTENDRVTINYTYRIVNTHPHQQDAFTQGLYFHNGVLIESTGLYGSSSLRKVNLATGSILDSIILAAEFFAEGITLWEDRVYQLTWRENIGFVYDLNTFAVVDTFYYQGEGWGLTHNDSLLIMSSGTPIISFRDPDTFAEVSRIIVEDENGYVNRLNELEFIDEQIFANVWQTDEIVVIDPTSGWVAARIDLADLLNDDVCEEEIDVLNGIAHDPIDNRLFVTGKLWCQLFEIVLVEQSMQ